MYLKNYIKIIDFTMRKTNKTLKLLFSAKKKFFHVYNLIARVFSVFERCVNLQSTSILVHNTLATILDRTRIHDEERMEHENGMGK